MMAKTGELNNRRCFGVLNRLDVVYNPENLPWGNFKLGENPMAQAAQLPIIEHYSAYKPRPFTREQRDENYHPLRWPNVEA